MRVFIILFMCPNISKKKEEKSRKNGAKYLVTIESIAGYRPLCPPPPYKQHSIAAKISVCPLNIGCWAGFDATKTN